MVGTVSFESQVAELLPRLRRFAHALSRDPVDADDLAQDTVERAILKQSQWQQGTRLDSWLYTMMRNLWVDTVRSRSRKQAREAADDQADQIGVDPGPALEAKIEVSRVMTAMSHLPDEQREVVALILVEGFGYRETADILKLPVGTVSSRLVRGRLALLESLG